MNGADSLCDTLLVNGIDVCFANPGTSEMHFVAALDRKPKMRCVLGLFEGVVTGAADGYARMADKPAATLLHLGPGLGNGLANLHNAKRARTPMVNVVGDHATYHVRHDAPLTSDVVGVAKPMSHWVGWAETAGALSTKTNEAVLAARQQPGQIATLILPADAAWGDLPEDTPAPQPVEIPEAITPSAEAIRKAAQLLRSGEPAMLLLGGAALRGRALEAAGRIARATGARVSSETSNKRVERGVGKVPVERVPYPVDSALAFMKDVRHLILVGSRAPVAFFAYPGRPSLLAPNECEVHAMATPEEDLEHALEWLAEELGVASTAPSIGAPQIDTSVPTSGSLTAAAVNRIMLSMLPEHAIVCDESVTSGRDLAIYNVAAAPHDWLQITGGAIGIGLPMATGAAVACPDRKVVVMQADGSGMYTVQALWTQARERLNVLTIVYANRSYATLHGEMTRVGVENPGRNAHRMMDLDDPAINWVDLARSMGVEALRADTVEGFSRCVQAAMNQQGPMLIEALI